MKRLALLAAAVFLVAAAPAPDWTGAGARNLPPFTTSGPWTVHVASSALIIVTVNNLADGSPVGVVTLPAAGKTKSFEPKGGKFYLGVAGTARWHIWVTPGP